MSEENTTPLVTESLNSLATMMQSATKLLEELDKSVFYPVIHNGKVGLIYMSANDDAKKICEKAPENLGSAIYLLYGVTLEAILKTLVGGTPVEQREDLRNQIISILMSIINTDEPQKDEAKEDVQVNS